jgi:hypothetical protein
MSTGLEQQVFQGENLGHASSQAFEVHLPGPPGRDDIFKANSVALLTEQA